MDCKGNFDFFLPWGSLCFQHLLAAHTLRWANGIRASYFKNLTSTVFLPSSELVHISTIKKLTNQARFELFCYKGVGPKTTRSLFPAILSWVVWTSRNVLISPWCFCSCRTQRCSINANIKYEAQISLITLRQSPKRVCAGKLQYAHLPPNQFLNLCQVWKPVAGARYC